MPCPRCEHDHDLITRLSGDQVLCPGCGTWLLVQFRQGGAILTPLGPPAPLFPAIDAEALLRRQRSKLPRWRRKV